MKANLSGDGENKKMKIYEVEIIQVVVIPAGNEAEAARKVERCFTPNSHCWISRITERFLDAWDDKLDHEKSIPADAEVTEDQPAPAPETKSTESTYF